MSILRWPEKMPETEEGRLPESQEAYQTGAGKVMDPRGSCERTLHVSLFFDGTNNNDDENNRWRDSKKQSHTNVARLFGAAIEHPDQDKFKFYIVGVGTPFPELGEETYSSFGKAFASGFAKRCTWGYTRILTAIYDAIMLPAKVELMDDPTAKKICEALDYGRHSPELKAKENVLAVSQQNRKDDGQRNRVIKHVWINVFGFSRGAAAARVFLNKLIKEWAPDGKIAGSIAYGVNFVGLFDTVASVGPPDSINGVLQADMFDGHFAWASKGNLNIPDTVQRCVHFFSIHEQRMSFPLDTVRMGAGYPQGAARLLEVAYPGVHSDVGGGYVQSEQGKSREGDHDKLSRIPLHDMYIEALKAGVPLLRHDGIKATERLARDFRISPQVSQAFNAWLDKVIPIQRVEDAMEFGMRQNLLWRTLRARVGTPHYITNQPFYQAAPEEALTPNQVHQHHAEVKKRDSVLDGLQGELSQLESKRTEAARELNRMRTSANSGLSKVAELHALNEEIKARQADIKRREEELYAEVAGKPSDAARPGEEAGDIVVNDRTDLREGAEDFRLLLAWLHPDQRDAWQATITLKVRTVSLGGIVDRPDKAIGSFLKNLGLRTVVVREGRPRSDSRMVVMLPSDIRMMGAASLPYSNDDDAVLEPAPEIVNYLRRWTSAAAVDRFAIQEKGVVKLFDDYIHDSRAWFRVPHFHEYAPGGYGWVRTFFIGSDTRVRHLGITKQGVIASVNDAVDVVIDAVADAAVYGADAILDALDKSARLRVQKPRL
ncbi:DUF2235 domain-containing protein [Cupriavidus sp. DL-D2]|uniref:phospholipase effector Tle1 domain-containing protein n=1 Tax=Cupriavidus sp. DL-D2 TaxID=3144974 RepID=UPI003215A7BF